MDIAGLVALRDAVNEHRSLEQYFRNNGLGRIQRNKMRSWATFDTMFSNELMNTPDHTLVDLAGRNLSIKLAQAEREYATKIITTRLKS